jgi:hypothetical protein
LAGSHESGSPVSSLEPLKNGPRHCGQFPAITIRGNNTNAKISGFFILKTDRIRSA